MRRALVLVPLALAACGGPGLAPGPQRDLQGRAEPETTVGAAPQVTESAPPAAERPAWLANTRLVSNGGAWVLHMAPAPGTLPDNETFELELWISDAEDEALSAGVTLSVDAAMPQHGHGMNRRPIVRRVEDGHFVVEGMYFHMTGRWELYLDVTRGAVTERTQCTVELADG